MEQPSKSVCDVIEARRHATATTAKEFLDTLEQRVPFQVKALQVDGGSEFYSDFEEETQKEVRSPAFLSLILYFFIPQLLVGGRKQRTNRPIY